jgi:hypothetical protein
MSDQDLLFSVGFRSKLSIKCPEFGYNLRRAKELKTKLGEDLVTT